MAHSLNRRNWLKNTALMAAGAAFTPWSSLSAYPADITRLSPQGHWLPDALLDNAQIRLLANENPYGPSAKARKALADAAHLGNRYGWQHNDELKQLIAAYEGVKTENILVGPGSSDLLCKAGMAYGIEHRARVISANPTYMSLLLRTQVAGAEWVPVPLAPNYAHDLDAMEAAIDARTRLVYLCNPNNPTGTLTPHEDLRAFCRRVAPRVPVFVDEAYNEFLPDPKAASVVGLIAEGQRVLVAKTFSKVHGMAGLRIGYLMGPADMLERVRDFGDGEMGLSIVSLKAAIASYQDLDFVRDCLEKNAAVRSYTEKALQQLDYAYIPSHTNFMMFPIRMETEVFRKQMAERGVGIRVWIMDHKPWCRVSIGTREEMETFIETLTALG